MSWASALFQPDEVAVVGSCSPGKMGHVLITQLLDGGYVNLSAINPKAEGLRGVPAARSLQERAASGARIDLAVIASPAATVADVLTDAGRAGVRVAVILSAGFSECGHRREEDALLEIAREYDMRLVGPNCAGIVNTKHKLYPTLETRPPSGDVAFISQSGALGGAVLSWAEEQGVGFSKFVSYGNAVDLTEVDFLDVLRDDEQTRVVALYIETVSDGRRFMSAARALAEMKPLIVIKSGRSESGGRATQSHTGSMAGSDAVYDAALSQCGAIRVAGIEEMFDLCRGFLHLPAVRGRRIAIVTNSGGPGVLAADACDHVGLDVASPGPELRGRLADRLPAFCSLANPFDLTVQGTENDYRETLIETLKEYDAAVAINVNTPYLDAAPLARGVTAAARATGKPIAASFVAGRPAQAAIPVLSEGGVPNFVTGERSARVLAHMAARERREVGTVPSEDASADTESLPWEQRPLEPDAMDWLEGLGFGVIPRVFARTAKEAVSAAQAFKRTSSARAVSLKIVSPRVVHKSELGGVELYLTTAIAVRKAFSRMKARAPYGAFEGVLVSPMVEDPIEAIVGLTRDPHFGPVVAVGLGGIYTEAFKDVALRVAPVSVEEARRMIESLAGLSILRGTRGKALRDMAALARCVCDVSRLPLRYPGIRELDLNPVFLLELGCWAGDVRLIPVRESTDQRSE